MPAGCRIEQGQIVAEWMHIEVDRFTLNVSVNK